MPKSKRNTIQKTQKTVKKDKQRLADLVDKIENQMYLLRINNQKNIYLKELRNDLGLIIMGKTKVLKHLLTAKFDDISEFTELIKGNDVALLISDLSATEIQEIIKNHVHVDFPKSGFQATFEYQLNQGPIERDGIPMPNNMQVFMRKLGVPCRLEKGVLVCECDYVVCKKGDVLTPEQANILKQMGVKMQEFKVELVASVMDGAVTVF
jgi:mRNA turnover protein 4